MKLKGYIIVDSDGTPVEHCENMPNNSTGFVYFATSKDELQAICDEVGDWTVAPAEINL